MLGKSQPSASIPNIAQRFAEAEAARTAKKNDPYLTQPTAILFVALSVLIMAFSAHFSVWPIALFLVLWLSLLVTKGLHLLRLNASLIAALAVPLLCFLSTAWSDYPRTTLYLGTAFIILNLCTILLARTVRTESLILGLTLGIGLTLLIVLLDGRHQIDPISADKALVGPFFSKNQVGLFAEIGAFISLLLCFSKRRWLGMATFILCAICLVLSQSATSVLSFIATIAFLLLVSAVAHLPARLRVLTLVVTVCVAAGATILATKFGGDRHILNHFGKDSTLTGRTYLWDEGLRVGAEHPLLGHGYSAFWVHGQPQAERYWQEFYIAARSGFHFHSTYVQGWVDLGAAGLALLIVLIGSTWCLSLRNALRSYKTESILLLGLSTMFLLRSFVEVDLFTGPFSIGALLFYALLPRLARKP